MYRFPTRPVIRTDTTRQDKRAVITRRALLLGAGQLALISVLAGRLYQLQIPEGNRYRTLSEENRIKLRLIAPLRGVIADRYGYPLAENIRNFRLVAQPNEIADVEALIAALSPLVPLKPEALETLRTSRKRWVYHQVPITLADHLDWDRVAALEVNRLDLPGVTIDVGQSRHYPLAEKTSHVLGYMGTVTEAEAKQKPLYRLPDFRIGKNGLERSSEHILQGRAGIRQLEVNARGGVVRELGVEPSIPGETLRTTLDLRLQEYTAERLGEESASAVIMEIPSGKVLALASMPAFDSNRFSQGIRQGYWKELLDNPRTPLVNKCVAGQYPPGSTFKMLIGLAGLKAGTVNAATRFHCPGHFYLGRHRFGCWRKGGHGSVNMEQAIAQSCDTYFYHVAHRLGIQPIADMCRKFSIGELTGIELPHEKSGIMPDPAWKRQRWNQPWQGGDTINTSIGQGYVLTTPVQLAVMIARLVTGLRITPTLLEDAHHHGGAGRPAPAPLDVDAEHLALVQTGMDAVTNSARGTAYWQRIMEGQYAMGGKTGTSQVRRLIRQGVDQSTLPWEQRHHGLFVGYAPVSAPRYVVSVVVEHGGGGSSAAAPIARDLLHKVQTLPVPQHHDTFIYESPDLR